MVRIKISFPAAQSNKLLDGESGFLNSFVRRKMSIYKTTLSDNLFKKIEGKDRRLTSKSAYDRFDVALLGLGDLSEAASSTDAIAAVFDLEGFTNFCKQIEPHLSVPIFLSQFLPWLMERVKKALTRDEYPEGVRLYSPLPFFVKFMGDGLLFLWNASEMGDVYRRNIIVLLDKVCKSYTNDFFPKIRTEVVDAPKYLRCGIARGTVFSVGNGTDFVGSCINMAARIQKLPGSRFAFNKRGFDVSSEKVNRFFREVTIIRRVAIRGIGDNELIGIRRSEFERMTGDDKNRYRDP